MIEYLSENFRSLGRTDTTTRGTSQFIYSVELVYETVLLYHSIAKHEIKRRVKKA